MSMHVMDPRIYVVNACGVKVLMLADPDASFTKALGLEIDLSSALGNVRSKRYSLLVENNVVTVCPLTASGHVLI
jgi:peroxiredoxin